MKTEEDEAFDDLARRQGMWGGGYQAKRQAAMDKINSHFDEAYKKMHEDRAMYGTSWSKDGERIDPTSVYLEEPAQEPVARVLQIIKELRPAIKPMEGMGKGKTTAEWFDILVKEIERIQPAQEPEREALKLAVDGLEKILHTFAKDGKVVMASMIRNELFAEVNSILQQAKAALAQPAQEKNND
jgi:hypothetical protein